MGISQDAYPMQYGRSQIITKKILFIIKHLSETLNIVWDLKMPGIFESNPKLRVVIESKRSTLGRANYIFMTFLNPVQCGLLKQPNDIPGTCKFTDPCFSYDEEQLNSICENDGSCFNFGQARFLIGDLSDQSESFIRLNLLKTFKANMFL